MLSTKPSRILVPVALATLLLAASGCSILGPSDTVVNSGVSTPIDERSGAEPWDGLPERTAVVAYEFGTCESDSDCQLRACNEAVCSPAEEPAICEVTPVGECLATLNEDFCGCNDGVCRWDRRPEVFQCAAAGRVDPQTRGYEGAADDWYPVYPQY